MISYSDHISSSNVAPFFDWSLFRLFHLGKKTPIAHWMILIDVQGVALLGGKSSGKTTLICSLLAALNGKCAFSKNLGPKKKETVKTWAQGPGQDIIKYVYGMFTCHCDNCWKVRDDVTWAESRVWYPYVFEASTGTNLSGKCSQDVAGLAHHPTQPSFVVKL